MADKKATLDVNADISQFQAEAEKFANNLKLLTGGMKEFGVSMQRVNAKGEETVRVMQGLTDAGERIYVTFRRTKDGFDAVGATMSNAQRTAQKLSSSLKEALAQQGTAAVGRLQDLFKLDTSATPQQLQSYQTAISRIINLFRDGKISIQEFNRILTELQSNPKKAISDLTRAEEALAKSIREVAKASNDAAEAQRKRVQEALLNRARSFNATTAEKTIREAVPTEGFDIGKLNQYEAALQRVKAAIASGQISFQKFQQLFNQVKLNPKAIIPDLNEQEQKVVASLRVITGGLKETRNASDRLSEAFSISFSGIVRLLEALTIKKFASSLISEFERSITASKELSIHIAEIRTISQQANVSTDQWAAGINKLASQFGNNRADIAEAAYQNLSNQVTKGKDTFALLKTELEFSKAAVTSAATSTNLLTAAMNSFRIPVEQSDKVAASLFKTIELGRVRADQIANTFGRVGAVAHSAGVSFNETLAALTTLTRQGITAQDAMTLLTNVLAQVIQPSSKLNQFLKEQIGVSGQAAIAQRGFVGVLQLLDQEAQKNNDSTSELTNNLRTLRGLIGLKGDAFSQYASDLKSITEGQESYTNAVKETQEAIGTKFQKQLEQLKIGLQESFGAPVLKGLVKFGELVGGDEGIAGGLSKLGSVIKYSTIAFAGYYASIATTNTLMFAWNNVTKLQAVANITLVGSVNAVKGSLLGAKAAVEGFLAANPFIYITAGFTAGYLVMEKFNEYVHNTTTEIEALNKKFEENSGLKKYYEDLKNTEGKRLDETVSATKAAYEEKYKAILAYSGDVVKLSEKVKTAVIENVKSTAEQVKLSAKSLSDSINKGIDQLKGDATKAQNLIQESKKVVENLDKKGSDIIFQERLKQASSGDFDLSGNVLFPNQKLQLIQGRIQQITQYARQEAKKGTQESIQESRRYYDEIENLERQKFETINAQRKAQFEARVAAGQETPTFFDQNGQARYVFVAQTAQLEQRINQITRERQAIEKQIQQDQEKARQAKLAAAQKEKDNERQLQELIKQVAEYQSQIYDKEGKLQPDFLKNPKKITEDFQSKISKIQELAGPDAVKNNLQFFIDLNKQKVAIERETQAAILQLRVQETQNALLQNKKQVEDRLKSSQELVKDTGSKIQDQSKDIRKFLEGTAKSLIFADKEGETKTPISISVGELRRRQKELEALREDAVDASKVFDNNKTVENFQKLSNALDALITKEKEFVKFRTGKDFETQKLSGDNQLLQFRFDQLRNTQEALGQNIGKRNTAEQSFENMTAKLRELDAVIKNIPDKIAEFGPTSKTASDIVRESLKGIKDDAAALANELAKAAAELKQLGGNAPLNKKAIIAGAGLNDAQSEMFGGIVQGYAMGGLVGRHRHHYDTGGWVGMHPRGSDTEPIMAAKGEYIVNANQAEKFAPLLQKINHGDIKPSGPENRIANIGDIHVSVHGGPTDETTVRRIAQGLRRELRRGTITLD